MNRKNLGLFPLINKISLKTSISVDNCVFIFRSKDQFRDYCETCIISFYKDQKTSKQKTLNKEQEESLTLFLPDRRLFLNSILLSELKTVTPVNNIKLLNGELCSHYI